MKTEPPSTQVGVLIGRFQAPELHKGQRGTVEAVMSRHKKVLVLLGCSPVKVSSNNPLDFMTRQLMVTKTFPGVVCLPISDCADDRVWSRKVDQAIMSAIGDTSATLYGSRDSFIPHYFGRYPTVELPASVELSGTQARKAASEEIRKEKGFRAGIIYSCWNRYPISYQCTDALIWKEKENAILLGRKGDDVSGLWRFLGGFVNPEDPSLEVAAQREAVEETGGIGLHSAQYLFSLRVEDWRYRKERDKILTAVFKIPYMFGDPKASDDIDDLRWFPVAEIQAENLVPEHREIWAKAKQFFL